MIAWLCQLNNLYPAKKPPGYPINTIVLHCLGAVDWVMMQSCFGHHFMLVLEKQEKFDGHQQFFAIVQLIGTRKQAENFAYR